MGFNPRAAWRGFWLRPAEVENYNPRVRGSLFAFFLLLPGGSLFSGDYVVLYKERVSETAPPLMMECDSVEAYPGYSKLITKGKPTFEVKKGALIATVPKQEYASLAAYAAAYPSIKSQLEEVGARWEAEIIELAQRKLEDENAFRESLSQGERIRTLDGQEFQGLIKASGRYGMALTTAEGVTAVGVAQLSAPDLKKWDRFDRDHDGRFWYERTLAVLKAREAGVDVAAESKEAEGHFPESSQYLAEMDQVRKNRRAAMLQKLSDAPEPPAAPGVQIKTQEDIDEMIRMSKLGYSPVLDEATGQIFYSPPGDREQQLRDAMQGDVIPEN